ncbi:hypothetical protein Y032_0015g2859 [Ancylostoma ceylanicum]|uniref:Uncharacterized protein n=1 Tax=Ancylostoma ceylanicum TaxID=53326 RepID=A0A016V977_9BILA|nr:hypothetical protein Y032_0015g2859 [Ancylostoma ceylanicum]
MGEKEKTFIPENYLFRKAFIQKHYEKSTKQVSALELWLLLSVSGRVSFLSIQACKCVRLGTSPTMIRRSAILRLDVPQWL